MTYYGSRMVVEHYNMMGPVKAALESATRYMAAELGPKKIRVLAISPGPLKSTEDARPTANARRGAGSNRSAIEESAYCSRC